jgi:DNA-binding response OmpR family regulator
MKTNQPPRPLSIMIVDDTPDNLKLLEEMLRGRGYFVRAFPRGRLALAAAANEPPDLIMLDINMPEMTGYETCERLKADPRLSSIPVIFISALNETLDKVKAFQCGGVDYVTKPFQLEEVQARVTTHLRLRQLQVELEMHNAHLEETVRLRTRELADAKGRLAILDKAKSDFLTLISHELRTPLNGLFGLTDLVFMGCETNPEISEFKAPFEESKLRLLTILDDAMLLCQIEVEGTRFAPRPVSLDLVLKAATAKAGEFAGSRKVSLEIAPDCVGVVSGHDGLLTKALQSLLETAVKFSKSGGTVRMFANPTPTGVGLAIEATGRVIPLQALPRFFDVLAIGESITPGGDLGLGPPVADRILSLFGGSVTVANREPAGIRFQIELKRPGLQEAMEP